ncbi:MAG: hypothetical protein HY515_03260 [Candidatus Aenigmarchaeota archaeon]|nr:hypothetical protein [Candidatus Aenigmarchaeota archaeon]
MQYKLSVSYEEPEELKAVAPLFAGVGMIRGEYLLRKTGKYITLPGVQQMLVDYVSRVAEMFHPRNVRYRMIEFPSTWISQLEGADSDLHEEAYMMGTRGIRRSLRYPDTFAMEADLITRVSRDYDNLDVLLPFVTNVDELRTAKKIIRSLGFRNRIGMMAEIPAAILTLGDFCEEGTDFITVGLNDLTSFTLATPRDSSIYNRAHPAVEKLLERVVDVGRRHGVETVLGGDINTETNEMGKKLGFDYITVFVKDVPSVMPDLALGR